MDGKGEKKPIPGISKLPAVSEPLDVPGVGGEMEVGRDPVETGNARPGAGVPAADEGEVIRLGVDEEVARGEAVQRIRPGGVGMSLEPEPGAEGDTAERNLDVEDAWESESRRGAPIGLIVLTGLLVSVVLIVAYWRIPTGDQRLGKRASAVTERLAAEQTRRAEAEALMEMIEDVLRRYLAAETVEEKARYVRHPERVVPLMQRYYQEHELVPRRYEQVKEFYPVGVENYPFLVVQVGLESGAVLPLLLHQVGENEILLDWESEVAYQPMSIAEFLERRPEEGVDFRVYVKYDQFYAFEFADSEKYLSLMLTERNSDGFLFGYVERGSGVHEEIAGLLGETEAPQEAMLLKLRFLPGSLGTRSVLVEKVVAPRWAYMDGAGGLARFRQILAGKALVAGNWGCREG